MMTHNQKQQYESLKQELFHKNFLVTGTKSSLYDLMAMNFYSVDFYKILKPSEYQDKDTYIRIMRERCESSPVYTNYVILIVNDDFQELERQKFRLV
jgi:hypothetical protein